MSVRVMVKAEGTNLSCTLWATDETGGTLVLAMPIDAASAKVRSGPPIDDEEDYDLPIWAGVLPYAPVPGPPEADPRLTTALPTPDHVRDYRRPRG